MTYLEEYAAMIERGEVIVGDYLRREVQNLIADLSDSRFVYDTKEAHKRIKFQETLCLQSKAPYYKQPMEPIAPDNGRGKGYGGFLMSHRVIF